MWTQFLLQNIHFIIVFLSAYALFSASWLYMDAWTVKRSVKELFKVLGLLLLSVSFVVHASFLETTSIRSSILSLHIHDILLLSTRVSGYLILLLGLIMDPLQLKPFTKGLFGTKTKKKSSAFFIIPGIPLALFVPILPAFITLIYLRRASVGLEKHLRLVVLAFSFLTLYELMSLRSLFINSQNINIERLVAPFSYLWMFEHFLLLLFTLFLVKWVWRYLLTRLQSQLFMIYTATILIIFLATTVTFTGLLVNNLKLETLSRLETDVKVLNFALDSKKDQILSDVSILAQSTEIIEGLNVGENANLSTVVNRFVLTKKATSLIIVDKNGQILARGENEEDVGGSMSDDPIVERSLFGEEVVGVIQKEGVLTPQIVIRGSVPVENEGEIVGAVIMENTIDAPFVDGIKTATGLETIIYADRFISASTLREGDEVTRIVGLEEQTKDVLTEVLENGEPYTGDVRISNTDYFGSYLPIKDVDNVPVGMLFVGTPQVEILVSAGKSIELTFFVAILMIIISVLPSYLIAKFISYQVS